MGAMFESGRAGSPLRRAVRATVYEKEWLPTPEILPSILSLGTPVHPGCSDPDDKAKLLREHREARELEDGKIVEICHFSRDGRIDLSINPHSAWDIGYK